jgi:hypothetical protein
LENYKNVEIVFKKDPGYRCIYGTGIWGGRNSQGDLEFDIYDDIPAFPIKIKQVRWHALCRNTILPGCMGCRQNKRRMPRFSAESIGRMDALQVARWR